jgi:hypothetical protein
MINRNSRMDRNLRISNIKAKLMTCCLMSLWVRYFNFSLEFESKQLESSLDWKYNTSVTVAVFRLKLLKQDLIRAFIMRIGDWLFEFFRQQIIDTLRFLNTLALDHLKKWCQKKKINNFEVEKGFEVSFIYFNSSRNLLTHLCINFIFIMDCIKSCNFGIQFMNFSTDSQILIFYTAY